MALGFLNRFVILVDTGSWVYSDCMDGTRDYKEGCSQCRPPTISSLTTSGKCNFVMLGQGVHIENTRKFRCSLHLIAFGWI